MEKIRIAIVDDSPFVREGLKIIFEMDENFEVVGCCKDGNEATILADRNNIDIFLMDIEMPVMNGIQATKYITEKTNSKVLILTTFDDDELIVNALKMGAKGYIIKNHPPEKIKQMVKAVYAGGSVLEDAVLKKVTSGIDADANDIKFDNSRFTERELDIIKLIAKGFSNKNIADKMFLTEGTVKNYISIILNKTGLSHRTQIAVYYLTGKLSDD